MVIQLEAIASVKAEHKKVTVKDISIVIKQNDYTHLHFQIIASHFLRIKERFLPRDQGKEKLEDIKSMLVKPLVLSEGFNTSTPL